MVIMCYMQGFEGIVVVFLLACYFDPVGMLLVSMSLFGVCRI